MQPVEIMEENHGLGADVEMDIRVQQQGLLVHYTSVVGELRGAFMWSSRLCFHVHLVQIIV